VFSYDLRVSSRPLRSSSRAVLIALAYRFVLAKRRTLRGTPKGWL
jgi:hypothetical protein